MMATPAPPELPRPARHQAQVWRLHLGGNGADAAALLDCLSDDERRRADRFRFDRDRIAYLESHALLRILLTRYLGRPVYREPFAIGGHGKPSLPSAGTLRFNLAHSADLALAAFAEATEIGVDVEQVTGGFPVEEVAEHFFSAPERGAIAALPADRRRAGFFHVWSQKEAYLKGRGIGVSQGLDHFDVEADPALPAALLADRNDPAAVPRWKLFTLDAGTGFRAALAVEGNAVKVRYHDLTTGDALSP
jgi:4'-phosphopantetheinyl transferase